MRKAALLVVFASGWLVPGHAGSSPDLRELTAAAAKGSADAQLQLALAYDEGRITPKNPQLARQWYAQAAAQGSGMAEMQLGYFSEVGLATAQDYGAARQHYERAISLGTPAAGLRLGILALEGWGAPRDAAAAVRLITAAAEAGDRPAEKVLADMYFAGVGVAADLHRAMEWETKAAQSDDPAAEAGLAAILNRINRQDRDATLAREWYQLSAEQDYTRGMIGMAFTFLRPGASPEQVDLGRGWLELAAEGKNSAAEFVLAGLYLRYPRYTIMPGSLDKAKALLERAKADDNSWAAEVLEQAKSGKSLAASFVYVVSIPFDARYVARSLATRNREEGSNLDHIQPAIIRIMRPVYPAGLRLTKTQGDVLVDFIVDQTGRVRRPKAVQYSHPGFAEYAVLAVANWRFLPGKVHGQIVAVHMRVPVYFRLNDINFDRQPFRRRNPASPNTL